MRFKETLALASAVPHIHRPRTGAFYQRSTTWLVPSFVPIYKKLPSLTRFSNLYLWSWSHRLNTNYTISKGNDRLQHNKSTMPCRILVSKVEFDREKIKEKKRKQRVLIDEDFAARLGQQPGASASTSGASANNTSQQQGAASSPTPRASS